MWIHVFKIAYKVLLRRKFFTFVSLFGTGLTILVLVVVAAMLDDLLAPRAPEVHLDRTLQVSRMAMRGEQREWTGSPGFGFLDRYCRDLPHVTTMSIFTVGQDVATFVAGEKIVSQLRRTDAAYWRILDFDFLDGRPFGESEVTDGAPVAVLTSSAARRIFRDRDPVGASFDAGGQTLRVIGVVRDVPFFRSSAYADIWAPYTTAATEDYRTRLMGGFQALLLVDSRARFDEIRAEFASRLPHVEMTDPEHYDRMDGGPWTRLEEVASEVAGTSDESERPRTGWFLGALGLLALLFMLLPAINLVNMTMSRIFERVSEIGVRKAFGASTGQLVAQFVMENVLLSVVGGLIGLGLAFWVLHLINASGWIPNADLVVNYRVVSYGLLLSMFFGVLSGAYPAWRMARLDPVQSLRGGER
ncbi:MAG: ABC transporter permease [Candidatus Eisenbacteria bacterium]|uniref:ABC transporter permease n=1 Tax=Eiseniibacteriota bacterium TaxID=2212470 RepID=A0A956LY43_UNCEI|nr:ABC transporter permease [Candidatus Eisenbacteria bacterium]